MAEQEVGLQGPARVLELAREIDPELGLDPSYWLGNAVAWRYTRSGSEEYGYIVSRDGLRLVAEARERVECIGESRGMEEARCWSTRDARAYIESLHAASCSCGV